MIPDKAVDPVGYLSVRYSYPKWIAGKFAELFGEKFTESLLEAGNQVPDLTVRANMLKITADELIRS